MLARGEGGGGEEGGRGEGWVGAGEAAQVGGEGGEEGGRGGGSGDGQVDGGREAEHGGLQLLLRTVAIRCLCIRGRGGRGGGGGGSGGGGGGGGGYGWKGAEHAGGLELVEDEVGDVNARLDRGGGGAIEWGIVQLRLQVAQQLRLEGGGGGGGGGGEGEGGEERDLAQLGDDEGGPLLCGRSHTVEGGGSEWGEGWVGG